MESGANNYYSDKLHNGVEPTQGDWHKACGIYGRGSLQFLQRRSDMGGSQLMRRLGLSAGFTSLELSRLSKWRVRIRNPLIPRMANRRMRRDQ